MFLIAEHYNDLVSDSVDISSDIHLFINSISMIKKIDSMGAYSTAHLKYVNAMNSKCDIYSNQYID